MSHPEVSSAARSEEPLVLAGLAVVAAMGVAIYALFTSVETRFTGWATRGQMTATGGVERARKLTRFAACRNQDLCTRRSARVRAIGTKTVVCGTIPQGDLGFKPLSP